MFGGYIPTNVIGYADKLTYNMIMWRTEVQKVNMIFKKDTGIADGKYFVPGLVWVFGQSLDLYAYKEWQGEQTELYRAPFLNINEDDVCLGTAADYIDIKKSEYSFKDVTSLVEKVFWESRFTHVSNTNQIEGSFLGMYEKSLTEFPYEVLVSSKKTVKKLCNEIFSS